MEYGYGDASPELVVSREAVVAASLDVDGHKVEAEPVLGLCPRISEKVMYWL